MYIRDLSNDIVEYPQVYEICALEAVSGIVHLGQQMPQLMTGPESECRSLATCCAFSSPLDGAV